MMGRPAGATAEGTRQAAGLRGARLPLAVGAVVLGATALLVVRTPYAPLSYGICPSVLFLGVSCPGCGGLRATHDLAVGDIAGAWAANPLWTVTAPLLVVGWLVWLVRRLRGAPTVLPVWVAWTLLAVVVAFGVLRNVPGLEPYLGP